MRTVSIETPTHGRVLIVEPAAPVKAGIRLVGFHGYAQSADDMLAELRKISGSDAWTLVSVQALNRFYTRGDQSIVASWMTRQDREQAIADNLEYIDRVLDRASPERHATGLLPGEFHATYLLGYSQGVAMAYRAGVLGRHRVDGIIAIGGDVPPEVRAAPADRWPCVLVAAGASDPWFTPEKVAADEAFLNAHGIAHEILRYDGGHEITDAVRTRMAEMVRA